MNRMGRRGWIPALLVAGASLAAAGIPTAAAQEAGTPGDSALLYAREVFDYPSEGRRNPFRPLNAGERIGPRFDDLVLTGILYNPQVTSVATLTDQKTQKRYRVREGDELGEVRVVEIRPTEVVFLITSYGVSRREVLRVKKDKEREG